MKRKIILDKRAYFFTLDAFIALLLILGIVLFVRPSIHRTSPRVDVQDDLLHVLSKLEVGEIDNVYVQSLIASGKITNLDQSVLEQIGEFYAESNPEANLMAQSILEELNPDNDVGLYFNGIKIATSNKSAFENARDIWTARQIISGIKGDEGESVTGFSARAFLSASNKVEYFYFGGYVVDGNITVEFEDQIIDVKIEAVFGGNFDLYINNNFANTYYPPSNVPYEIDLNSYLGFFNSGTNYIDFRSTSGSVNKMYIAGGFIKVTHDASSELIPSIKKNFPGIKGLINNYDGFYIPGSLSNMEVFLHYNSSFDIFLTIGNTTVYEDNSGGGEVSVILNNAVLSSMLDYSSMTDTTIPLRLGMFNASYVLNQTLEADAITVTDLSGSMRCDKGGSCWQTQNSCEVTCGGTWLLPINNAIAANNQFIEDVLNFTDNRVGLVVYRTTFSTNDYHPLSNNNVSLKTEVNSWYADGNTCICCGINKAVDDLAAYSDSGKFRSIVVMSDGIANQKCLRQNTGNAKQDAIKAACDAYTNYGIVTYAVGFGGAADEVTLQGIASCGGGSYYYSDVGGITEIYRQIAQEIIEASYFEQTIIAETVDTQLFSDSYIEFDYNKTIPYGLVITAETPDFGNVISEGSFFMPNDTIAYEVKLVSYSGSRWTDRADFYNSVLANWINVFDLSDFGNEYVEIGDPFVVNVPASLMIPGDNLMRVSTALGPGNASVGSTYDKIIYTLVKDISSFSPIVSSAEGCEWLIEFEDGSNSTISVPLGYIGEACSYTSSAAPVYNPNDAIDIAVFNLLESLDLNDNGKIETKFNEQDLELSTSEVKGIPFTWDTEVQARVWR